MKELIFKSLLPLSLLLSMSRPSLASATWYVNGVSGNDNNNCLSTTTACKTIGHAVSLASTGDSINVCYCGSPMRRSRSLNLGSERSESYIGSEPRENTPPSMLTISRCSKACSSQ